METVLVATALLPLLVLPSLTLQSIVRLPVAGPLEPNVTERNTVW